MLSRISTRGLRFNFRAFCAEKDPSDIVPPETTQPKDEKAEELYDTIKSELKHNPMFDRAFPHLSVYKEKTQNPNSKKELDFIKSLL